MTGTWTGNVVDVSAESGKVVIRFSGLDGDDLCGTVTLGEGGPPPPATDPEAPYPPGTEYDFPLGHDWEGFSYTMQGGAMSGQRVSIQIGLNELFRSFCQIQTPYPVMNSTDQYGCLPYGEATLGGTANPCFYIDEAGRQQPAPCSQVWNCTWGTCVCDESRCEAGYSGGTILDLLIDGDKAQGTMGDALAETPDEKEVLLTRTE